MFKKDKIIVIIKNMCKTNQGSNVVYCLGIIGASVYYIGHAATFWAGVLGFLKALIWPAFLVFQALEILNK